MQEKASKLLLVNLNVASCLSYYSLNKKEIKTNRVRNLDHAYHVKIMGFKKEWLRGKKYIHF